MLKKYFFILGILFISLASASMTAPESVSLNENFELKISISGFYALELNIPDSFQIISDDSGGLRMDLYRTFTSGDLVLTLRPSQSGIYAITGEYTSGDGIQTLEQISIQVQEQSVSRSCPVCPEDTAWSNCQDGKQIMIYYPCSFLTNYECVLKTKTQSCQMPETTVCDTGWVCKDENNIAYKSSDCSFSSVQNCGNGCGNGTCNPLEVSNDTIIPDLTIEIADEPVPKQDPNPPPIINNEGFISKIMNFISSIIDFLIFWK